MKVQWQGNTWKAAVGARGNGATYPACHLEENSLAAKRPEIADQWCHMTSHMAPRRSQSGSAK